MQEQVTVSGERGVIGRSLDWVTTRFGRKPSDLVFRGSQCSLSSSSSLL